MKALRCFLSIGLVCSITLSLFAQVADKLSYQAVIRNASGNVVSEKTVSFRVTILQGSATGASVYTQSQKPVTNVSGLITIEIGGDVSFSQIDWGAGPYFIKTEVDLNGGTNYSISGVSQLLSVPVALYAKTAETLRGGLTEADPVFAEWDKSEGISISGSQVTDLQDYLTEYSESDPEFTAWNKSTGISITESQISDLQDYLTEYSESDPEFTAWNKSTGISITESQVSDLQDYLTEYIESDPEFTAWDKSTGISITGSQISDLQDYLTEYIESDPEFTAWDKSTGISITESQISDLQDYLTEYSESDPEFTAWDKSTGISITGSQVSDLQDYLTEYSESDPEFTAWDKSTGISITESQISDLQDYLTEYSESDPDFNASPAASVTSNDLVNLGNLSGTNTGDQDLSGLATTALVESVSADVAQLQSELNALSIDGSETSLIAGDQISISGEGTTESPYAISLDQKELAFQRISGISQFIFSGSPNVWRQVTDLLITIDLGDEADVFVSYNVSAFAPSYYSNPYFATRLLVDEVDQVGMRVITSPSNASHCNNSISSIISLSAGTHTIRVEYRTNFVGDPLNNWPGNNDYQSRLLTVRELR